MEANVIIVDQHVFSLPKDLEWTHMQSWLAKDRARHQTMEQEIAEHAIIHLQRHSESQSYLA